MRRAGFTLPETVVALSLFAAAAVVLCQAAINARMGLARLDQQDAWHLRVDWVRDDILTITSRETLEQGGEIELAPHVRKKPKDEEDAGEGDREAIRVKWEVEIAPTRLMDVHLLTLNLVFEQGEELKEPLSASYYVYRPGWYEGDARQSLLAAKEDEWERRQLERGLR